jgi:small nuclear ribonucleoprotein
MERQQPMRSLQKLVGRVVFVRLKNNRLVRGVLVNYDDCMNMVLDEGEELDQRGENTVVKYGRLLIRGTQVLYVSTQEVVG